MQDNAIKQYKNINEKIQIPVSLKEDTIKLMKEGKQRRLIRGHRCFGGAFVRYAIWMSES